MARLESFLEEIDRAWPLHEQEKVRLKIIGAAALLVQTGYDRGTKDSDILETLDLTDVTKNTLLKLAGEGTVIHKRHRFYVQLVRSGVPFLRQKAKWNELTALNGRLEHFSNEVLDVLDLVISKLKRFSANDQMDIEEMIDRNLVDHALLVKYFEEAIDVFSHDARADDLPEYVKHLHQVERDMLGVGESTIELPSWIAE